MSLLWVLGLGAGAGYMMTGNQTLAGKVRKAELKDDPKTKPDPNLPVETIRAAQRRPDIHRYDHMNVKDLSKSELEKLARGEDELQREQHNFEHHGVHAVSSRYLTMERGEMRL